MQLRMMEHLFSIAKDYAWIDDDMHEPHIHPCHDNHRNDDRDRDHDHDHNRDYCDDRRDDRQGDTRCDVWWDDRGIYQCNDDRRDRQNYNGSRWNQNRGGNYVNAVKG